MKIQEAAARGFAAMGSEARLEVLRMLVRAGDRGLSVGEIQDRTKIAASTLAHHLKFLTAADLVGQQKAGRTTINRARFDQLDDLASYILAECCSDVQAKAANDG